MDKDNTISQNSLQYIYRSRNLPHKYDTDKPIFITYRLKFTIPNSIKEEMNLRKKEWQKKYASLPESEKPNALKLNELETFRRFDELLHKSDEVPRLLHRVDLTNVIIDNFHYFNNQRYQLQAFCIMPNHVHVLIKPLKQPDGEVFSLAHINYTWKRFTSNKINKILNRTGSLWQDESYDHLIQSDNEFYATLEYIINNPIKAGLVDHWKDWHGTWIREDLKSRQ